ncbi:restriction endonuclease [Mycobacterium sp.]|uniref:restriction endonuclease n=1 Tax=Mycobacterium sp. TaxID=1785 RepID=UPI003A85488F
MRDGTHPYHRLVRKIVVGIPVLAGLVGGVARHDPGAGFVVFYLALLLTALVWLAVRELSGRRPVSMAVIDAMDGIEFEDYVATRLSRAGWQVSLTPRVGDYGVDLIAEKDGQVAAIQCKRHSKPVGVSAVQQVVSGARHHGCTRSIVVSNQDFTSAAKQLAHTHGCQLIGRRVLQGWVPPPRPGGPPVNPSSVKSATRHPD